MLGIVYLDQLTGARHTHTYLIMIERERDRETERETKRETKRERQRRTEY